LPWEGLVLLHYSRCPKEFRDVLLNVDELDNCRAALIQAGFSVILPRSGAFAFVPPQTYKCLLMFEIEGIRLSASHVICSREYEALVTAAVGTIRSREHIKLKSKGELPIENFPFTDISEYSLLTQRSSKCVRTVRKTFLEVGWLKACECASVVSSTDAHLGRLKNPRQNLFDTCVRSFFCC